MSQKIWSSFATATLVIASFGNAASSYASQPKVNDDVSETNVSQENINFQQAASPASQPDESVKPASSQPVPTPNEIATSPMLSTSSASQPDEVSKVGEYQSHDRTSDENQTVASLQPHMFRERQAVTLYVRRIPVLTFLSPTTVNTQPNQLTSSPPSGPEVKVGSVQGQEQSRPSPVDAPDSASENLSGPTSSDDPLWRATALAARINQLHLNNVNAEAIIVRWDNERKRYQIEVNGEELVAVDSDTILPDTTNDPAADALQATNRLRRLMGNAPPLRDIAGRPQPTPTRISLGPIQLQFMGMASWYGPGFHGNRSANGEIFDQNAMTAAHRNLPFGTRVRVTNLDTGQSVVVRITDRGPYAHGRVIDLSAGAARVIGLFRSGVAPVRLDVLGATTEAANN
jgi:rare lipoprotein A